MKVNFSNPSCMQMSMGHRWVGGITHPHGNLAPRNKEVVHERHVVEKHAESRDL